MLIPLKAQGTAFEHGDQIMCAGRRRRLPERRPGVGRRAQRKANRRLGLCCPLDRLDAAARNSNDVL
jgi:hypothetical protein